jgi:hypothetical protein
MKKEVKNIVTAVIKAILTFITDLPIFFEFAKYRSLGLNLVLLYLIVKFDDQFIWLIFLIFTLHTYLIFRQEKGANHKSIIKRIDDVEIHILDNQKEMLEVLKLINSTKK